jgi:hypothetical protein
MIGRSLTRRLKQLEAHSAATSRPIFTIAFVSSDKTEKMTLVLGPNGARTWTDLTDPSNPRTWTADAAAGSDPQEAVITHSSFINATWQ